MNEITKEKYTGVLLMAGTAILWSIGGLFIKVIDWNPFNIAFSRSLIASIVIIIFIRKIKFKLSFPLIAAGISNALTMMLFVIANKTTTAANAIILQYIAPVITAFLSYFLLKEKVGLENFISVIIITIGVVIMFFDKVSYGSLFGNVIAIISAFTFSFYFIFMRMQKDGSTIESVLLSHIITVITCFAVSIFIPLPKFSPLSIMAVFILGIFQIGLTSILFAMAIKKISAITANLIAVIEPVCNPIWVFIAIGEKPQLNSIIGGVIIVISVTVATIISAKRKNIEFTNKNN
jgi:drug/metabolite transporter (DMT)-like permease